jgi:hypothetical protein
LVLLDRTGRAARDPVIPAPALDVALGDVLDAHRPERRQQVGVELGAIAADRRGFAAAVLLREAQVLVRRLGEGHAG